jgi:hypothetical protein
VESWRRVAVILRGDEDLRRTSADAGRKEGRKEGREERKRGSAVDVSFDSFGFVRENPNCGVLD